MLLMRRSRVLSHAFCVGLSQREPARTQSDGLPVFSALYLRALLLRNLFLFVVPTRVAVAASLGVAGRKAQGRQVLCHRVEIEDETEELVAASGVWVVIEKFDERPGHVEERATAAGLLVLRSRRHWWR